ncbi:SGNH/GDSL hydrolase family protein [Roseateles sp. P5_E11]
MASVTSATGPASFSLRAFDSVLINGGKGTITFTSAAPNVQPSHADKLDNKRFGPFGAPMTVQIAVTSGVCNYSINYGDAALEAVSGGGAGAGNTVVTLGDSRFARDWTVNAGTPVVTGTVGDTLATCTLANHKKFAGDTIKICNAADQAYNCVSVVESVVSSSVFTYRTPVPITSAAPAGTAEFRDPYQLGNNGIFNWANILGGGRYRHLRNAGNTGEKLRDMRARIQRDVIDQRPAFCVLLGGTNNARAGDSADTMYAEWLLNVGDLRAAGIRVLACTEHTYATGASNLTAAKVAALMKFNRLISTYAQNTPGMLLADFASAMSDTDATDGASLTTCFEDSDVHQSPRGAYRMGKELNRVLSTVVPPLSLLPSFPSDSFDFTGTLSKLSNPLFQVGAGGTVTAPMTGTAAALAASWRYEGAGGGATLAATLEARTVAADGDALGSNSKFVGTMTANNDSMQLRQNGLTARVGAGRYFYAVANIRFVSLPSTTKRANLTINMTVDGVTYSVVCGTGTTSNVFEQEDFNGTFVTPLIRVPANAVSITAFEVVAFFQTSGAATAAEMHVGRVNIYEVV